MFVFVCVNSYEAYLYAMAESVVSSDPASLGSQSLLIVTDSKFFCRGQSVPVMSALFTTAKLNKKKAS